MAEGPQVHRISDALRQALRDRALAYVRFQIPRLQPYAARLMGARVLDVQAHGKHLLIHLEEGWVLHSHLMMWGRWEIVRVGGQPRKNTGRLWLSLTAPPYEALLYNGPVLEVLRAQDLANHPRLRTLGPDPLRGDYRRSDLLNRIRAAPHPQRTLAEVLLDQSLFAGVGNIYKSESLWLARLNPARRLCELTPEECGRLVEATERVLHTAYRQRFGTLPRRLWRSFGPFAVYRRSGLPCLWCGCPVHCLRTGRVTYFCPGCQPPKTGLPDGRGPTE